MEEAREGKRIGGEIVSKLDDIVINCQKSCNECLKCEYNGDEYFKGKMVKLFNAGENLDSKKGKLSLKENVGCLIEQNEYVNKSVLF